MTFTVSALLPSGVRITGKNMAAKSRDAAIAAFVALWKARGYADLRHVEVR